MRTLARVVVVAVLVGCTGSASSTATSAETNPSAEAGRASDGNEVLASALISGRVLAPGDELAAGLQELIAVCVRAEGFEYYLTSESAGGDTNSVVSPADASAIGLGISTLYFDQSFVGPDLLGALNGSGEDPNRLEEVDANDAYYESLGPATQDAYYENKERCELDAIDQIDSTAMVYNEDLIIEAFTRYMSEPDVIAEAERIANCLADLGFGFLGVPDAEVQIEERIRIEVLPLLDASTGDLGADEQVALEGDARASLREIQAEEFLIAAALVECGALPSQRPNHLVELAATIAQSVSESA